VDTTLSDPLVGRVIDGRYRVESLLARGGMATVYQALDTRLDRSVALKVMHSSLVGDPDFVSRFIREAKSAARLSHPNVVAVYDQGTDAGHVFLTMEHVEGRTLRDVLRSRLRLRPGDALDVLKPVLAALGAAHRAGIVHRDVKPENVLIATDGRVKVADFGLARAATTTSHHTSGVLIGTVAYLAPEQVERGIADARSDVYAAGVMLYELLTGRPPFVGESAIAVAYQHVHADVPPPSRGAPGIPPEIDALVAQATARDPDLRPADASRFLAEVARVAPSGGAQGVPITPVDPQPVAFSSTMVVGLPPNLPERPEPIAPTEPPAPGQRRDRRRRSRRGPLALALVLLLTAGVAGVAWWYGSGPGTWARAPGLIKMSKADATRKATDLGFQVAFGPAAFSENIARDHVVTTNPGGGTRIEKGGLITVTLSKGPERYAVPSLRNRGQGAAERLLGGSKLVLGKRAEAYDSKIRKGRVIASEPKAATKVKRGTPVNILVSKGDLPNVTGQEVERARQELQDAGLKVAVTEEFSAEVPPRQVVSQNPDGGTVRVGSTVKLVVSKGPELVFVPRVIGFPVEQAEQILRDAGLKPSAQRLPFGPGNVVAQQPEGGTQRPRGSTVRLAVL
jgi:beta-lactam-binding protein with PASTA domain